MNQASLFQYAVAVQQSSRSSVSSDWQSKLAQIQGVKIIGATRYRAQIEASPEVIAQVIAALGDQFLIEEVRPRSP